jgi:putative Mn2+ efflux pump MntP
VVDIFTEKKKFNEAQKIRVENTGVLLASGLIAGEALMGLAIAIFAVFNIFLYNYFSFFKNPTFYISFIILAIIAYVMIQIPLKNAGKPDEPAPPASGM